MSRSQVTGESLALCLEEFEANAAGLSKSGGQTDAGHTERVLELIEPISNIDEVQGRYQLVWFLFEPVPSKLIVANGDARELLQSLRCRFAVKRRLYLPKTARSGRPLLSLQHLGSRH